MSLVLLWYRTETASVILPMLAFVAPSQMSRPTIGGGGVLTSVHRRCGFPRPRFWRIPCGTGSGRHGPPNRQQCPCLRCRSLWPCRRLATASIVFPDLNCHRSYLLLSLFTIGLARSIIFSALAFDTLSGLVLVRYRPHPRPVSIAWTDNAGPIASGRGNATSLMLRSRDCDCWYIILLS